MENSIEEALEKLSTGKKIKLDKLLRTFKREGIENFVTTRKKYVDVILSDYKRLIKENEELKNKLSLKQFDINIVYNDYLEKLYKYEQNSIPIQKIKDKIKKNKNLVEESNDGDIIRKLNQENEVLQDLLEEEKQWEKYIKAGN